MRYVIATLLLGAALAIAACNPFRNHTPSGIHNEQVRSFERTPTAEQLVQRLNANAQKVQGVEYDRVFIDVKQGNDSMPGLTARLACQKPRNFRLEGIVASSKEVDMGSNDQEFWYWIKRNEPQYVYHCSHEDFRRGVSLPFPFQPEWIMEALGMAIYDETKKYELRDLPATSTIELIEQTVNSQGQPVRKVTVFDRNQLMAGRIQAKVYVLQDANGKPIATATVKDVQHDPSGVALPKSIRFAWPAEKVEMTMKLEDPRVGAIAPQRVGAMFSRNNLSSYPSFNLARGGPDRPLADSLQRVGGGER